MRFCLPLVSAFGTAWLRVTTVHKAALCSQTLLLDIDNAIETSLKAIGSLQRCDVKPFEEKVKERRCGTAESLKLFLNDWLVYVDLFTH